MSHETPNASTRREFLKTSTIAAGALAGSLAFARSVHAAGDDTLKLGLIGCGGRGTGAANNALNADQNVKLVAMADTFEDKIKNSLNQLTKELKEKAGDKIAVSEDHHFSGFDAYQKLIDSGVDVVILATPPHFRPMHLKAAVAAGKHVLCGKASCRSMLPASAA